MINSIPIRFLLLFAVRDMHFFSLCPEPMAPVGLMEALNGWPPSISSTGYNFLSEALFLLQGSCCLRKLLDADNFAAPVEIIVCSM